MDKQLMVRLEGLDKNKEILNYLIERKIDPLNFGAINGYIQSLINQIEDRDLRKIISNALSRYIDEYFWAGVFVSKNNPDKIKMEYQEIKEEEEPQKESYLGW